MRVLLIIFLVVLGATAKAQLPSLIPYQSKGKFGYSDSTKKVIINPDYEKVYPFYNGMARVRKNRKFGFIDSTGEVIIPLKYAYAEDFCVGISKAGDSRREAFGINTQGEKVDLPEFYDRLKSNRDRSNVSVLIVSNGLGKYGLLSNQGYLLLAPTYRKISTMKGGTFYIAYTWEGDYTCLNANGKQMFEPRKGKVGNGFYEGLCSYENRETGEKGYFDTTGMVVFINNYEYKYNPASKEIGMYDPRDKEGLHFSEGKLGLNHQGKFGFIDKAGNEVIPFKYDMVWNFKDGFAKVKLNGKYGFINHSGKEITAIAYDEVNHFYEGLAFVKKGEKCGYIDTNGEEVIPLNFDHWRFEKFYDFKNGLAFIKNQEHFGLINSKGEVLIEAKYDEIQPLNKNRAIVKLNVQYGLVDYNGNEILPLQYKFIDEMSTGAYRVVQGDKQGLFDTKGKEIFPIKFSRIEPSLFGPNLFLGSIPGDYSGRYYIDKYGVEYKD